MRRVARPTPYEHRAQAYKDLIARAVDTREIEVLYEQEEDPWLRKILAERLVQDRNATDSQAIRATISVDVFRKG